MQEVHAIGVNLVRLELAGLLQERRVLGAEQLRRIAVTHEGDDEVEHVELGKLRGSHFFELLKGGQLEAFRRLQGVILPGLLLHAGIGVQRLAEAVRGHKQALDRVAFRIQHLQRLGERAQVVLAALQVLREAHVEHHALEAVEDLRDRRHLVDEAVQLGVLHLVERLHAALRDELVDAVCVDEAVLQGVVDEAQALWPHHREVAPQDGAADGQDSLVDRVQGAEGKRALVHHEVPLDHDAEVNDHRLPEFALLPARV
mmetsp:Transcript_88773/g.271850  ORF Transcript_88773/g.271850 Transcript_88773/m.271850 type:complete len:258 (-) Transcript_88773:519-1292(-)